MLGLTRSAPASPTRSRTERAAEDTNATTTTSTSKSRRERRLEKLQQQSQEHHQEDSSTASSMSSERAVAPTPRRSKSSRALLTSTTSSTSSTSNAADDLATSTAPMGRVDRRSMLGRQKSQPLLPRQRSLKDLKKSKAQAKVRPALTKQGSFTTKQSEFAALEALIGKTRPTTATASPTTKRKTIRKCKSLDASGFVATGMGSSSSLTSKEGGETTTVGERRPVALTSPKPMRNKLAPVTMPSRVGDRRRMLLQNRTQSMKHLSPKKKKDELHTASEHCHSLKTQSFHSKSSSPETRRGLMLRQGSFVAGSRMRTLRG